MSSPTKPLFDSEQFAFIGSSEDSISVHCRKCGNPANIKLEVQAPDNVKLSATCTNCRNHRTFTFVNVKSASGPN